MKRTADNTWLIAVAALALLAVACDSGLRTPGGPGGGGNDMRNIVLVDGGGPSNRPDGVVPPQPDVYRPTPDSLPPQPQPDAFVPKPDTAPQQTGPQPPFGNSVGMTASNFTVPDCSDSPVTLHDYYNKGKAVIVMLNKGS
jgi:hypothetical protein